MELATPLQRLQAVLIDLALLFAVYMVAQLSAFATFLGTSSVALALLSFAGLLGLVGLIGYQWWLLATAGQTIGKRWMGLRIVRNADGENGGFVPNVLLRTWINGLINLIPFYFLVDSLFIFRADRRCVHDFLAGTKVVKA